MTDLQREFIWLRDHPEFEQRPASITEFLGADYLNIEDNVRPILKEILIDLFGTETNPDRIAKYQRAIFTGGIGVGKGHVSGNRLQGMESLIKIEDVQVGDELIGSNGKPTTVTGVYPRGMLPVYRVTFSDGSSMRVDGDHLWAVERQSRGKVEGSSKLQRIWKPEVASTADLASRKLKYGDSFVYKIPLVEPVQWPKRDFVIDPYLMGVYLGDGDSKGSMRIACKTKLWLEANLNDAPKPDGVVMARGDNHLYFTTVPTSAPNPYLDELTRLGLRGVTSRAKFIPDEYLRSSPEQRLSLLRGLMDSDGTCSMSNSAIFSSYSHDLAEGVRQLTLSLGGMATLNAYDREQKWGEPDPVEHHVKVNLGDVCPFGDGPKRDRWKPRTNQRPRRAIVSIEPDGSDTVTCISVDADDKLYVAGEDWIVTHNTTLASVVIPYMAHWVLCLKDPQAYFGLMAGSRIAFMQMSTSEAQAKEVVFGDIKARIDHSPWFKKHYQYDKNFKSQFHFPKDIWIIPGDSAETTFEGYNILGGILDEADSHKVTKNKDYADQGYTTIHGRITSRFEERGFLLVIGQMKKATGFAAKTYRTMRQDPDAYTALITIWESMGWDRHLKPDGTRDSFWYDTQRFAFTTRELAELQGFPAHVLEVPRVYERDFLNSPQKALRDLAGRPPAVNSPLFHDPTKIEDTRKLYVDRCGDFIPVDAHNKFHSDFHARNSVPRVGHIDIAFSPDGDSLGLAIAHVAEIIKYDNEKKPFIVFDLVMRISAPPGRELYLGDIRQLIYELKYTRKFNIAKITTDGFQCIVGDMIIPTLDGQNRTIAELAQTHPEGGFWTYSYNHTTGRIAPGRCTKAWKTGTKPVLEVLLDSGEIVKTTHDHRFMMRDGSYREARDLRSGDSLMPLYRDVTPDDWKGLKGYERIMQPGRKSGGRWQYTHRMVAPPLRKGEIVHHKDFGKRNNAPENLEVMTVHDHRVLHAKAVWEQPGHREKMSRIISESNRQRTGTDARRRRHDVTIEALEPFRGGSWRIPAKELGISQDLIYARVREAGFNGWNDFSYGEINGRCVSEPVTYRRRDRSNHKVVSVTDRGETEDVYDLSIAEHHNFAIGAGVFIHNSTDMRQQFQRKRIQTELLSADRSTLPYFDLHDAVAEGRVAIPPYLVPLSLADPTPIDIVYQEMSQLQDEGSKIDHPPDGSKDVADAIACTVSSIMNDPRYHRASSSGNPMGDWMGGRDDSNGDSSFLSRHPAIVGSTPRAPIAPRISDPTQWRPPTRRT